MILDPQGKEIKSEDLDKCPNCGRSKKEWGPSGGFGEPWTICPCGKEFKERPWRLVTP
jgi:hypothetical protein